ncbi:hypothetical protein [Halorussus halophilus]|uniref:hypothetical protein n=1 Tax=Halorussus halophilus TaxID=2650975 RepID=UPI0013011205|nr:hypothetical protein [Halorussus halophilus]
MISDLKRASEGRSGQVLTTVGMLMVLYWAITDLLRGPTTISQLLGNGMTVVVYLVVLFATLWPHGDDVVARKLEAAEPFLSAGLTVFFGAWALYLWISESGDLLLFSLLVLGVVLSVVELIRRVWNTDDSSGLG